MDRLATLAFCMLLVGCTRNVDLVATCRALEGDGIASACHTAPPRSTWSKASSAVEADVAGATLVAVTFQTQADFDEASAAMKSGADLNGSLVKPIPSRRVIVQGGGTIPPQNWDRIVAVFSR